MGARSVRQAIADVYDPQQIDITIVWTPMLDSDNLHRAEESSHIFNDHPGVRQFWDPQRRAGSAFRSHAFPDAVAQMNSSIDKDHFFKPFVSDRDPNRPEWDIYMFFDKSDRWIDSPPTPGMWLRQTARYTAGETLVSLMWKNDFTSPPFQGQVVDQLREMASDFIAESSAAVTLEYLSFPGCPNSITLRQRLHDAIGQLPHEFSIDDVNLQELNEDDPRLHFGSPTILINGKDLMGVAPMPEPALACRPYTPGGLPGLEAIKAKLKKSRATSGATH